MTFGGQKSVPGSGKTALARREWKEETHSLVGRDVGGDTALGAAVAGEGGGDDLDVPRVRSIRPTIVANDLSDGAGGGERGEDESDGTHFGCW